MSFGGTLNPLQSLGKCDCKLRTQRASSDYCTILLTTFEFVLSAPVLLYARTLK